MPLKIVDSHFHFYDKKINNHPILVNYDENLALLWGKNYLQKLPEYYLPTDYFKDMEDVQIDGLVMAELVSSQCQNVYIKTAIECIFGLEWSVTQIAPWIKTVIDIFSPARCMFGSHLPITKCSKGVRALYEAYQTIAREFSEQEQQALFADTARGFYHIS